MRPNLVSLLGVGLVLLPTAGFAHTPLGDGSSFAQGLAHPFSDFDHVLAMVAVGLFAWRLGTQALWLVPTAFVLAVAAGGALGFAGVPAPVVELGIALSVIVLGLFVALRITAPVAIAIGIVALFGIFHGHAHGTEMPIDAGAWSYATGFLSATALLQLAGIAFGFLMGAIGDRYGGPIYRVAGVCTTLAGLVILVHAL